MAHVITFRCPAIEVSYGDTLVIRVHNSLDVPTTLHSHGLFQNGTNEYDGPAMITQCPIPPGHNFTYQIPIQQTGSYWIHGHNRGQYVDGLRAPLIIKKLNETLKYDEDITVSVSDWYHQTHPELMKHFLGVYNPMGFEPVPDVVLINEARNTQFKFTPGKTYRLRFVCMAAIGSFRVYIDGHDMQIVEIDGVDVEPYTVTQFLIAPAQRYSVLVTARSENNGTNFNYNIHSDMDTTMFDDPPSTIVPSATATIVYNPSNPIYENPSPPEMIMDFDDTLLVPVEKIPAYNGNTSLPANTPGYQTLFSRSMMLPKVPSLFTAVTIGDPYQVNPTVYGPNTNPTVFNHLDVVDLIISNTDPGNHPFHFHGHVFQVLKRSSEAYDPSVGFLGDDDGVEIP
ncbi:hypothetical protein HDU76_008575, partial [Blyttiomyces sp. JEL0837]